MTEPTTQAGKALLDEIGQLVRTIRIAAKVPDSEIVPGATRQHFLDLILTIEKEPAATARAEAEVSDQVHAQLVADYDAALADAARLREHAHDWRHAPFCDYERGDGPCSCGLAHAQAPTPDADKWLAEREEKLREKWLAEHNELFAPFVERTVANYLAAHPNLLDLDSPDAERRLSDALPHGLEARPAIAHHVITALRALSPTEQPVKERDRNA